jgi:hypothetical protein
MPGATTKVGDTPAQDPAYGPTCPPIIVPLEVIFVRL